MFFSQPSQNKTMAAMFLRTNFNEFHTSITAVRVRLFHYYSFNLNRHQMCPEIWDFDPGHNNSPPCPVLPILPVLPVLCGICFWRCRPHWPLIVFLPIRTTGGDSRLNKILFKFYCFFLIWTYKKTTNETFTLWIASLFLCYLMDY